MGKFRDMMNKHWEDAGKLGDDPDNKVSDPDPEPENDEESTEGEE